MYIPAIATNLYFICTFIAVVSAIFGYEVIIVTILSVGGVQLYIGQRQGHDCLTTALECDPGHPNRIAIL